MCAFEDVGIKKLNPAPSSDRHMHGNVNKRRLLLPNVSIVQTAGQAKRKLYTTKTNKVSAEMGCKC